MVRDSYLQIADRHIAETEQLIAQQRQFVEFLAARGRDIARAQEILITLETGLASFRAHRERVSSKITYMDKPENEMDRG